MFVLQPRFGGTIIDIVSGDLETPQQKSEAVSAVNRTILGIFLIVIIGYEHLKTFSNSTQFYCRQMIDIFVFSSICTALRAWLFSSASERIVAALRKNLFSHLVNQVISLPFSI